MTATHWTYNNQFTTSVYNNSNIGPRFVGKFNSDEYMDVLGIRNDGVYIGVSQKSGCTNGPDRDTECENCLPRFYETDPSIACNSCVIPCDLCTSSTVCESK